MIKYHVLALLCLVAAAISAVEFLAISMYDAENQGNAYLSSGRFWLMIGVFGFSVVMYFRIKRMRKELLLQGKSTEKLNIHPSKKKKK
jgi:cell division protein FtsW (lipid II flippase)